MQNYSDRALANKPIADAAGDVDALRVLGATGRMIARKDSPDKLDYDRMARVVSGLEDVIEELANP